MKEHVKIFTGHSLAVNHLASLLDQNNIPYLIKDREESARLAGFGGIQNSVELYVYGSDVESAREIVDEFEKNSMSENEG